MDNRLLVTGMAAKCRETLRESNEQESKLPKALHPKHLLWMCDQITEHSQQWPATRLHRWIGFVQGGILANRMLNLEQIKGMFSEVDKSLGLSCEDQDLVDHLDPGDSFAFDIGGQG
jgi:hypothetical protein